jgi:diguanylate cyclase (GGDEF)-like protein
MPASQSPSPSIERVEDALAAALSRAFFLERLESAVVRAATDGRRIVLCLLDVDQLRNVNDRHGQAAGDAALRAVATCVVSTLEHARWSPFAGVLGRFDGDGLIVMLRDARLQQGEELAEELRRRIASASVTPALRVTVSAAVAAHRPGESTDSLLARTEKTLHLAKQFGGDRIETARTREPRERRARTTSIDFLRASACE